MILKAGIIKLVLKEFQKNKKEILKLLNLKNNKKLLDEFSFLNQDIKLLKKKNKKLAKIFSGF